MPDRTGAIPLRKPTPGQRLIAELIIAHPDWTDKQIVEASGLSSQTSVKAIVRDPAVNLYMSEVLDRAGATREASGRVIAEAHDATTIKQFQHKGTVIEAPPLVDHPTRLDAAKLNLRVRGDLEPDTQIQINQAMLLSDEQLLAMAAGKAKMSDYANTRPEVS